MNKSVGLAEISMHLRIYQQLMLNLGQDSLLGARPSICCLLSKQTNVLDNGVHSGRMLKIGFKKQFIIKERDSNSTPNRSVAVLSLPFSTRGTRRILEYSRYSASNVSSYVLKTSRPLTTSTLSDEHGKYFSESCEPQVPGNPIKLYSRSEQAAVILLHAWELVHWVAHLESAPLICGLWYWPIWGTLQSRNSLATLTLWRGQEALRWKPSSPKSRGVGKCWVMQNQHDFKCVGKMHENDAIQAGEVVYLESALDELRDLSVAIALLTRTEPAFISMLVRYLPLKSA